MYGFMRLGVAVPMLRVADCTYNTEIILEQIKKGAEIGVQVLTFPELCITSYTCGDLFFQTHLLKSAEKSLEKILTETKNIQMVISVGLPVALGNQIFNCSALLYQGAILGVIPKTHLPNYNEFYEKRWFSSANDLLSNEVFLCGQKVPIGNDLIFTNTAMPECIIAVEICEDLWSPIPPSSSHSLYGATIILNPSASNELVGKHDYRKNLVCQQSSRCLSAYVYASAGIGESTQDTVFSGHSMIAENGAIVKETKRFERTSQLIFSDVDLERLVKDRQKNSGFMEHTRKAEGFRCYRTISFSMEQSTSSSLEKQLNINPFVPQGEMKTKRCEDIINIQVVGLARRMEHTHSSTMVVGISGGLDSTLALLVAVKACDYLELDHSHVLGITMPGFGTSDRTYYNALNLMTALGIRMKEISIKEAALLHFKDIEHDPSVHDVTYENTQARERTQILMDISNKENGFVVGTGDLSELALGWATYNGDHMSMYGVNSGVPKTLVRELVYWVATYGKLDKSSNEILLDVLETPISPELLPPDQDGKIMQKTEDIVGPYEIHDFFLYYIIRYGFSPAKILFLADKAFDGIYDHATLLKWLKNFYRRFFMQQFKRSCLPDGPKVGSVSLSPRGDWRMPTDAFARIWMDEVEKL